MSTDETQTDRIERKLDDILAKMEIVEKLTSEVIAEVKPTIDALMASPVGKMLGVRKK